MGIVIITDIIELAFKHNLNRETPISVQELRDHYPQEFIIKEPAKDAEVRRVAALASRSLGSALAKTIRRI